MVNSFLDARSCELAPELTVLHKTLTFLQVVIFLDSYFPGPKQLPDLVPPPPLFSRVFADTEADIPR